MTRLQEEVVRVLDGDADGVAFHGPSTQSNLVGVTHTLAAARPIPDGHSIWELVAHLKVGREWSLARLNGEKSDPNWWPALSGQGQREWDFLLEGLRDEQSKILAALGEAREEDVQAAVRFLIHHELYHSGQIAILRRALGLEGRPG